MNETFENAYSSVRDFDYTGLFKDVAKNVAEGFNTVCGGLVVGIYACSIFATTFMGVTYFSPAMVSMVFVIAAIYALSYFMYLKG